MAKRVVIFVLLGPILVWLSWMILHLPDLFLKPGGSRAGPFFLMVLLFVMALGIIPGAVLAWVDRVMTDRGLPLAVRVVVCGALGYPLTLAAGWWIGLHKTGMRSIDDNFYWGGLFGVIAAAVCSWLMGRGRGAGDAKPPE